MTDLNALQLASAFLFLISHHAVPVVTSKVCEPANLISMIHKGPAN